MVNVHKTEEITYTSVKTPVTRSTVETNTNPQDALYLQTKDLVLKAEDCAETAIETLEEIQSTAAEIQEDLNAKRNTILNEITLQKQAACNDISETGTTYIELAEQKFNEIMELNLADQDLSNITTNGINVIKQALSDEIESINNTLETKLNKADCAAYITETYNNGTSWYRIYSNGWCEQGGVQVVTSVSTMTFLKPFIDTNYTVLQGIQAGDSENTLGKISHFSRTKYTDKIGYSFNGWTTSYTGTKLNWQASGYIE